MRAAWPAHKPMGIRVSATDWVAGGFTPDEAVVFAKALEAIGCDYIDVSTGGLDHRQKIPLAAGYQVPFGAKIREETSMKTLRTDERRVGKECISQSRSRWSTFN